MFAFCQQGSLQPHESQGKSSTPSSWTLGQTKIFEQSRTSRQVLANPIYIARGGPRSLSIVLPSPRFISNVGCFRFLSYVQNIDSVSSRLPGLCSRLTTGLSHLVDPRLQPVPRLLRQISCRSTAPSIHHQMRLGPQV